MATLYLPLFGLLQENVNRLNVKEVSPFTINHTSQVRTPPSGVSINLQPIKFNCFIVLNLGNLRKPEPLDNLRVLILN